MLLDTRYNSLGKSMLAGRSSSELPKLGVTNKGEPNTRTGMMMVVLAFSSAIPKPSSRPPASQVPVNDVLRTRLRQVSGREAGDLGGFHNR
jgi:hypothetical protein